MKVHLGDSLEVMRTLADNSVDSVVTDPPYGLRFMSKHWDYEVPSVELWREVLRVLKPGGHVVSFGGPRTYHRMASGVEDAGFEIRDQLQWLFGSGFPKSMDISKAIDKAAGAEREVTGRKDTYRAPQAPNGWDCTKRAEFETAPSTDEAKTWTGWGTALKPANEPIVLARKPLSEKTVAKNVLKHGTGALNIDASRISFVNEADKSAAMPQGSLPKAHAGFEGKSFAAKDRSHETAAERQSPAGRWPSNVLLACACHDEDGQLALVHKDDCAVAELDRQAPECGGGGPGNRIVNRQTGNTFDVGMKKPELANKFAGPKSGASRFFYVAKTSKRERNAGLDGMPNTESQGARPNSADGSGKFPDHDHRTRGGNNHPTVKPVKLMEYLIRLITPLGGTVLDPFMGSGSTGVAAKRLGFDFIGIEREAEYVEIAEKRISHA